VIESFLIVAAIVAISMAAGYYFGTEHANDLWIAKANLRGGRKELNGELYWVVDAKNAEACCYLMQVLEAEQDNRDKAAYVERIRKGAR
jgi:hypothetical protein